MNTMMGAVITALLFYLGLQVGYMSGMHVVPSREIMFLSAVIGVAIMIMIMIIGFAIADFESN